MRRGLGSCGTPLSEKNPPPLAIVASTFLYPFQRSMPPWASRILPSSSFIRYPLTCLSLSITSVEQHAKPVRSLLAALPVLFEGSVFRLLSLSGSFCSLADRHLIETPTLRPPIRTRCGSANTSPNFGCDGPRSHRPVASAPGQSPIDGPTRSSECRSADEWSGRR